MNHDLHYLQKPFITVGAIFCDEVGVSEILSDAACDDAGHKGFCYTFKAEPDSGLQVGDYAVVHANDELKIVKIVQVHDAPKIDIDAHFEYKWVVQKIGFTAFRMRQQEQANIDKLLNALQIAERQEALKARLERMSKKNPDFAKALHTISPAIAALHRLGMAYEISQEAQDVDNAADAMSDTVSDVVGVSEAR